MKNLLIIDDEKSICNVLSFAFENEFNVFKANSILEYNSIIKLHKPDIVLLDLKFGSIDGLDVLQDIKSRDKDAIVIVMTAYGTIETSIEAIKGGAYDYILKPLDIDVIKELVKNSIEYKARQSKASLDGLLNSRFGIIGQSAKIKKVFEDIDRVKDLDVNVLIQGESGTGKELVARAVHYSGKRKDEPFVVVNCAAIPQNLIESELFGYEKGAFTGAERSKKGAFEMANNGSIFLDEIGEMDLYCQAKVLRAIQNKEIAPIGSNETKKINARIITATNRDLKKDAEDGSFRIDLYYRLNVFPITIASLEERREDVPLLIESFIKKANNMYKMNIKGITNGALEMLVNKNYTGNVRELENIVCRACIMCDGDYINEGCLKGITSENKVNMLSEYVTVKLGSSLDDIEKQIILDTINFVNGNKAKAAKLLGISERSIHYKVRSYLDEK